MKDARKRLQDFAIGEPIALVACSFSTCD